PARMRSHTKQDRCHWFKRATNGVQPTRATQRPLFVHCRYGGSSDRGSITQAQSCPHTSRSRALGSWTCNARLCSSCTHSRWDRCRVYALYYERQGGSGCCHGERSRGEGPPKGVLVGPQMHFGAKP